jgi:hypothetical protein
MDKDITAADPAEKDKLSSVVKKFFVIEGGIALLPEDRAEGIVFDDIKAAIH